jgi:uncharacterized cupredoxin-like copper-binding protein
MTSRSRLTVAVSTMLAAAATASLAGSALAAPSAAAGGGTTVTVKETEYHLGLSTRTLVHGRTYTVVARDAGKLSHSLLIDGKGVSDRGIHNANALTPGTSRSFTVRFPKAGTYRFYCAIRGHAQAGMQLQVKVS